VIVVGDLPQGALYAARGQVVVELEHGAKCATCGQRMPRGTIAFFEWDSSDRKRGKATASGYSIATTTLRHRVEEELRAT
jgi:hypothetical protein